MDRRVTRLGGLAILVLISLPACSTGGGAPDSRPRTNSSAGASSQSGGSTGFTFDPGAGGPGLNVDCVPTQPGSPCNPDTPVPPGCGDGKLSEDEACDDGNRNDDDGCQANCLATQPGFSCSPPGKPCHELVICGDKIVGSSEQCDD